MATIYPGQIFHGYIKAQHNVHGPIRFSYKGMWSAFRSQYFLDLRAAGDDAGESVVIKTMAMLITKWNIEYPREHPDKEKAGKPVPITIESIEKDLMSHVRNHMMGIISWGTTSDIDPESPTESKLETIALKASKKDLAEIMAEADAILLGN